MKSVMKRVVSATLPPAMIASGAIFAADPPQQGAASQPAAPSMRASGTQAASHPAVPPVEAPQIRAIIISGIRF